MKLKEKLKRLGFVRVANGFILNDPQAAIAVFEKAGFLPLSTAVDEENDVLIYFGFCHRFNEVPEGVDAYPFYIIEAESKGLRIVDVTVRQDKGANDDD